MPHAPAARVSHNEFSFYSTVIPGKQLLAASTVSRRSEDAIAGFNRALSHPRAREIARYLDQRSLSIPTNLILSAQRSANIRFEDGTLSWDSVPGAFLVLDGQHRLFSMSYAEHDYDFLCAIYDGLTPSQEVQLFIDINTNQIGVPPSLLLDIKQLAGTETSEEERLRQLFDIVGSDRGSPLQGLLSPAAARTGYVSRVTFNGALKRPISSGVLSSLPSVEDQARLLINYLSAANRTLVAANSQKNLTKSTLLQAFCEVMDLVVEQTLGRAGRLKRDDLVETMEPLQRIDFDSYIGGARPSKVKLVADMRACLVSGPILTADMF